MAHAPLASRCELQDRLEQLHKDLTMIMRVHVQVCPHGMSCCRVTPGLAGSVSWGPPVHTIAACTWVTLALPAVRDSCVWVNLLNHTTTRPIGVPTVLHDAPAAEQTEAAVHISLPPGRSA